MNQKQLFSNEFVFCFWHQALKLKNGITAANSGSMQYLFRMLSIIIYFSVGKEELLLKYYLEISPVLTDGLVSLTS